MSSLEKVGTLTNKSSISRPGESALLIQQRQHSHWSGQQHVQHRSVVRELHQVYRHALRHILLLLPGEDMLVEVILDLFVGDVDA